MTENPNTMLFSEELQTDLVFNTLDYDAGRGSHTIESLLGVFRGVFIMTYQLESAFRLCIGGLLQAGHLDMGPDGRLHIPPSTSDTDTERWHGAWYSIVSGRRVGGPFLNQREALLDVAKFSQER